MMISAELFGEKFGVIETAAGGILLLGAFFALSARPPVVEEPA
jgi:ABC-type uncharacterized transport system permease subunit